MRCDSVDRTPWWRARREHRACRAVEAALFTLVRLFARPIVSVAPRGIAAGRHAGSCCYYRRVLIEQDQGDEPRRTRRCEGQDGFRNRLECGPVADAPQLMCRRFRAAEGGKC